MSRFGPKLEKKQAVLFRMVEIGAELFAMSATCAYAAKLRGQDGAGNGPVKMADIFCRHARRRIDSRFERIFDNDDTATYRWPRRSSRGSTPGWKRASPSRREPSPADRGPAGRRGPLHVRGGPALLPAVVSLAPGPRHPVHLNCTLSKLTDMALIAALLPKEADRSALGAATQPPDGVGAQLAGAGPAGQARARCGCRRRPARGARQGWRAPGLPLRRPLSPDSRSWSGVTWTVGTCSGGQGGGFRRGVGRGRVTTRCSFRSSWGATVDELAAEIDQRLAGWSGRRGGRWSGRRRRGSRMESWSRGWPHTMACRCPRWSVAVSNGACRRRATCSCGSGSSTACTGCWSPGAAWSPWPASWATRRERRSAAPSR
jgi:hypothetical protein